MPLRKDSSDAAFRSNLKAEIAAGKPQSQALAIAYSVKRKNRAIGGPASPPWFVRNEVRGMTHSGPIMGIGGGRTDHYPMKVSSGSYVIPSDHVSSLGQGNTLNGMAVLHQMFGSGPYGGPAGKIAHGSGAPRPPRLMGLKAAGGAAQQQGSQSVPIYAAAGEYVIEPEKVAEIGGGDMKKGHEILDEWVKQNRKKHIKTLKRLPPPATK